MELVQAYTRTSPERAKPFLGRLNTFIQHEGEGASYQRVDRKVVNMDYKKFEDTLVISRSEIPTLTIEGLCKRIDELGARMATAKFKAFIDTVDEAATESGNSQDLKGQPFSQEHYLTMLEGISMSFDEDGNWEHPTLIAHPTQIEKILGKLKEWESDDAFQKKVQELKDRKRTQFYDRENLRKLAD